MKRIIIDTDMGSDDYIAVQLAMLSKKIKVEGISLVHGNTTIFNVKRNIFKTLDMIDKLDEVKIYEGMSTNIKNFGKEDNDNAHGSNGFSDVVYETVEGKIESTNAIDWMIDLVKNSPKKISIVAIGPLTNIASAILKDSEFAKNIKSLIIMGGAENFGNITPYAEFNFYKDPYAASVVFNSKIKDIVMIGFNITKEVTINTELEKMLLDSNDSKAKFIYDISRASAELDRNKNKVDGAIINDAINICYLLDKTVLKLKKVKVEIELDDMERLGESKVYYNKDYNCNLAVGVNRQKCIKKIFKTLLPNVYKK